MKSHRISNIAPVGSLLKRSPSARRPAQHKTGRERNEQHLALIRKCPCLHCGCSVGIEAAHVQQTSAALGKRPGGIGMKRDDRWVVPLCQDGHREQHRLGEAQFWGDLGINPVLISHALWMAAPDVQAMVKVVKKARK